MASQCIAAVKKAVGNKPLSVKFRLGVQDGNGVADFAKMCADSGADFVTVHFRTRKQMYSGQADYSFLPQVVKCGIPVFANGDVSQRSQYLQLTSEGAFGVAVGRAGLGRPYVFFANCRYSLHNGRVADHSETHCHAVAVHAGKGGQQRNEKTRRFLSERHAQRQTNGNSGGAIGKSCLYGRGGQQIFY